MKETCFEVSDALFLAASALVNRGHFVFVFRFGFGLFFSWDLHYGMDDALRLFFTPVLLTHAGSMLLQQR